MAIITLNKNNFEEIKNSSKPVLLDFYADWCGPCRMVAPIIHEIAEEREDVIVGKINVDETPELAIKYGVESIPTLIVLKNGEISAKSVGVRSKEAILEMVDN